MYFHWLCQSYDGVYWTMLWILHHCIWRANIKHNMNSEWKRILCRRYCTTLNASRERIRLKKLQSSTISNSLEESKPNHDYFIIYFISSFVFVIFCQENLQRWTIIMMTIQCETPTADGKIIFFWSTHISYQLYRVWAIHKWINKWANRARNVSVSNWCHF